MEASPLRGPRDILSGAIILLYCVRSLVGSDVRLNSPQYREPEIGLHAPPKPRWRTPRRLNIEGLIGGIYRADRIDAHKADDCQHASALLPMDHFERALGLRTSVWGDLEIHAVLLSRGSSMSYVRKIKRDVSTMK